MNLDAIRAAGERRRELLGAAELEVDHVVDELVREHQAGRRANIAAAAAASGIARTTLYRALDARRGATAPSSRP